MDERQTRLWLAAEAKAIGRGSHCGDRGLRKRIGTSIRELEQMAINPPPEPPGHSGSEVRPEGEAAPELEQNIGRQGRKFSEFHVDRGYHQCQYGAAVGAR